MIYLCALLAVVAPQDGLTAAEIVHRSAVAQNISVKSSRPNARLATLNEGGHTWTSLVVVKPPNKLLIRDSYPWLNYTVYRGFDGVRAWTSSNFGGGGLANPDSARTIISTMAWYTDSDMIPGRWAVDLKRLPDQTIDGKSYFTIEEHPKGGNPSTVWIDKTDYSSRAESSRSDRFFKCVKRQSIRSICLRQQIVSGGRVVGMIDIEPVAMQIDDLQFEMPEMLDDSTTSWVLDRYAKALGREGAASAVSGQMQQIFDAPSSGASQVQIQTAPTLTTQWHLQTTRPQAFTISQSYNGRVVWRLTFDGTQGIVERMGIKIPATYASAIMGWLITSANSI